MNTEPATDSQLYTVTGLHCDACVNKVEKVLSNYANEAKVSLTPPRALLKKPMLDLAALNQVLGNIGDYSLSPVVNEEVTASLPDKKIIPAELTTSWFSTYRPLLMIIGYILLTTLAIQISENGTGLTAFNLQAFHWQMWMMHFMAGFFLVFSFFKLLNLKEFANSYAMYDLLAIRVKAYGLIYPFIELGLGLAYVLRWQPNITNLITFIVMGFSSLGVIRAVMNKQKIRCACLGSVFNLPMSTITIIEDLLMAGMAAWMLVY